jgi:hypothetical protein
MKLMTRISILLLSQGVVFLLGALIGWFTAGTRGLAICSFAMAICFIPSVIALLVSRMMRGKELVMARLFIGMGIRSGVPLLIIILAKSQLDQLSDIGGLYYILAFYFSCLFCEIGLDVADFKQQAIHKVA